MVWLTPPRESLSAFLAISNARRRISMAARRVNVSIRMRPGSTPWMTRCATRCASVSVLPVPAPATISKGPHFTPLLSGSSSPKVTAFRCGPFNFSRCDVVGMCGRIYGRPPPPVTARVTDSFNLARHWRAVYVLANLSKYGAVCVQHFDLSQTQLADGRLDGRQVTDDDPGEGFRMDELARGS